MNEDNNVWKSGYSFCMHAASNLVFQHMKQIAFIFVSWIYVSAPCNKGLYPNNKGMKH